MDRDETRPTTPEDPVDDRHAQLLAEGLERERARARRGRVHRGVTGGGATPEPEPIIIQDLVDYGYDLGYAVGLELGRTASAILTVLRARGIHVSETVVARVLGCDDLATLAAWRRRAVTAARAEDVFTEG